MNFKAERINGKLVVKPNVERKANGDLTITVPAISIIQKLIKEEELKENNGKRNI